MKLSVRPLEPEDFDQCWAISTVREKFSLEDIARLRDAWAYLIPRDEAFGAVVEDMSDDPPRISAFGFEVFATDEWMEKLRSFPQPLEVSRLPLQARKRDSNMLSQRQIGLHNA